MKNIIAVVSIFTAFDVSYFVLFVSFHFHSQGGHRLLYTNVFILLRFLPHTSCHDSENIFHYETLEDNIKQEIIGKYRVWF